MIYITIPETAWYKKLLQILLWPWVRIKCRWNKHIQYSTKYGILNMSSFTISDWSGGGGPDRCGYCNAKIKWPKGPRREIQGTWPKYKRITLNQDL